MKNIKSKFQASENEKGVASILAIGICTILIALAITYVTTAIIEKKASTNYQNLAVARLTAQTSFTRALAYMKEQSYSSTNESFNLIVSHDENIIANDPDSAIYWDDLSKELTTEIKGDTYYTLSDNYPTGDITDTNSVTWIYLRINQTNEGSNESDTIVSRIAYVVIPDKGKINPWTVIDSGVNAANFGKTPPSESNYGGIISGHNYATSVDANGNYVIGRPGRNLSEISLESLEKDSAFLNTYSEKMSVTSANIAGLVPPNGEPLWVDFSGLFDDLGIATTNITTRNYFREVFYLNSADDPEAFWIDISNDSIRDSSELYHRFELNRTDWDTLAVNELENSSKSSFDSTPGLNCPPWLTNWRSMCGYSSTDIARKQILANLIDYCDSDTDATTDSQIAPTYVGLERCPYINEVKVQMIGSITRSGVSGSYNFEFKVIPVIYVELVDMYGITNTPSRVYVDSMRITYDWGTSTYDYTTDTEITTPYYFPLNATPSNSYTSVSFASPLVLINNKSQTTLGVSSVSTLRIRVKIINFRIRLTDFDGNALYDYSILPDDTSSTAFWSSNSGTSSKTRWMTVDYSVSDPRQNLNQNDWQRTSGIDVDQNTSDPGTVWEYPANINTPGEAKNSIFIPYGTDKDPETATQPWEISTAYIRNAPMQSPWELGFIHRAKAFQTLNLKKYNDTLWSGITDGAGGDTYANGDANILDQIKMTSDTYTKGKININSDNKSVLRALFDNIKLGSNLKTNSDPGFHNAGQTNTAITRDQADTLAYQVTVVNGSKGTQTSTNKPFSTRAQVVNRVPFLSTDDTKFTSPTLSRLTDAIQEELIGKFINLTKEETPNLYTVIAVGQVVKDIGGRIIYKDLNDDNDADDEGEQISTTSGKFDKNADEILSSQKILAIIKRNPTTNKFYIYRMMYLSE